MTTYQLGDRVKMNGTCEKARTESWTRFVETDLPKNYGYYGGSTDITEGVIIGRRTVQDGRTEYTWDDPPVFLPEIGKARRVWLVSFNLDRKPVMCFDHQITPLEEDQ